MCGGESESESRITLVLLDLKIYELLDSKILVKCLDAHICDVFVLN